MEEIADALRVTAEELGWKPVHIAALIDRGELSARLYLKGETVIGGPELLKLLRAMPGLRERLLPFTSKAAA